MERNRKILSFKVKVIASQLRIICCRGLLLIRDTHHSEKSPQTCNTWQRKHWEEVRSFKELDLPSILIDIGIEDRLPDPSSFPLIFRHF